MSQTEHRPVLIVIAGPNGSGKTTITSKILKHEWLENVLYINPDQVAQDRFGDWNSPEAVLQAAPYSCRTARNRRVRRTHDSLNGKQVKTLNQRRVCLHIWGTLSFFLCRGMTLSI